MSWNLVRFFAATRPSRLRHHARLALEALEARLAPAVNVLTYHNDIAATGTNTSETQLTPASVAVGSFIRQFAISLDGQVYAQPLVDTALTIAGGTHDIVFVATEHDSLYALDASTGSILWQRSFLDPTIAANNTLGATAISSVPSDAVGTDDLTPEIGITGTPVIDSSTGTLYLVAKTQETIGGIDHVVQRLHSVNISDGTDQAAPFLIGDTTAGNSNNTSIYVYGSGDGAVTDPYNNTGKPVVGFNALRENQRAALRLVNNTLYVAWSSHGDIGPYHGWVVAWDVSHLGSTGFTLAGVFNDSPNGGLAGIWQGGGGPVFEPDGSAFYVETGNGPPNHGNPTLDAGGFPADGNYYEALVKVVADPSSTPTSQNLNGWGLKAADYFIPYNMTDLDNGDVDFGSGGPLVLPDSAGISGHPHLMVAAGKEGKIYVVDRDNMGKFDPSSDHVVNAVPDGTGHDTPPVQLGGGLSTPAYWGGTLYWTSGYSSPAYAYQLQADGTLAVTSQTKASLGYLPGSAVVSASGSSDGIVWIMDRNTNRLRACDATNLGAELWDSGQKANGADAVGGVVKFAVPTVANGMVYVGTSTGLAGYGLAVPTAVPAAPSLTAAALTGTVIELTWTDPTAPPNLATGYLIEQSSDGTHFTQVATAGAGAVSQAITGLQSQTTYYFRIRGVNALGNSDYSAVVHATTTSTVPLLDFSGGFAAAGTLTLNGPATLDGSRLELTDGGNGEAGSAFSTQRVNVGRFDTQFTFQLSPGAGTADGFTFTIQGAGPTALGASGGDLGYAGIGRSVAVKFDLYNNNGEGVDSTGLFIDGAHPYNAGSIDLGPSGINLHTDHVFQVGMDYDGTTLAVQITDTLTGASATQDYPIDIPATAGAQTAYVGFTAGTGGLTAIQDITAWTFSSSATAVPAAPSSLTAAPPTGPAVSLSWKTPAGSNPTGYYLDRASDPDFTLNAITEKVPAGVSSFTDSAAGLTPGGTFYYRIHAYNTAGDSAYSSTVPVTIPLPPPAPTNAQVTGVTSSEIDLSWTDNAGTAATGYVILRQWQFGPFTPYANLPASSATPPTTLTWSDTNLFADDTYAYEIEAVNGSGNSGFATASAETLSQPPQWSYNYTSSIGGISLSWYSFGATSYNLYRGTAPGQEGNVPLVSNLTSNAIAAYTDHSAQAGVRYYYVVTALNGNGSHVPPLPAESAPSSEVAALIPLPPTHLTATTTTFNTTFAQVVLSWQASSGATSYQVYRSTRANSEGIPRFLLGTSFGTTYTDNQVDSGTAYYYKVTAVSASSGVSAQGALSSEVHARPLFGVHINFTTRTGKPVKNYLADVGLAYLSQAQGLTFGWNQTNTGYAHDVVAATSPDELHSSFAEMQPPTNPAAWWGIAVPNGTYTVHLIAGDPGSSAGSYRIAVGGTLSSLNNTVSGGTLAVYGTPTKTTHWFAGTVKVTVKHGVLYVSNAPGARGNKIDEIDIQQL